MKPYNQGGFLQKMAQRIAKSIIFVAQTHCKKGARSHSHSNLYHRRPDHGGEPIAERNKA